MICNMIFFSCCIIQWSETFGQFNVLCLHWLGHIFCIAFFLIWFGLVSLAWPNICLQGWSHWPRSNSKGSMWYGAILFALFPFLLLLLNRNELIQCRFGNQNGTCYWWHYSFESVGKVYLMKNQRFWILHANNEKFCTKHLSPQSTETKVDIMKELKFYLSFFC